MRASRSLLLVVAVTVAASGFCSVAFASTTLYFSEPDFVWHHTGGAASPYHIWIAGDYWAQSFANTQQPSADQMWLTLFIDSNLLSAQNQLNLDVVLNANVVGSASVPAGLSGPQNYFFTFPATVGPDYTIQVRATNTIPALNGAVSIGLDERSFATLAPEPAGLPLLGGALFARRRGIR